MSAAAEIAVALGDARREGFGWRCRCPLHGGRSLTLRDGQSGRILATCWGAVIDLKCLPNFAAADYSTDRPLIAGRVPLINPF
jgi:hypothetical protein